MDRPTKLHVYKCPACAGAVQFDAASGKLACRWCGNEYAVDGLEAKEVSAPQGYLCPECGAEIVTDDFMAAFSCPYCGNNEVAPQRFENEFKPDFVIPFKLTKSQALERYERLLAEKDYLPDDYAQEAQVVNVQGTYVPFWLHTGEVGFDFTWYCDNGAGKNVSTCHRRRAGTFSFSRVPADGSEHMPDDMMDSIEPYDFSTLVPFSADYLPGFLAERPTVAEQNVTERIGRRVKNSAQHAAAETIEQMWKHKFPTEKRSQATVTYAPAELALLPVWLFVVAYKGKKYLVGVNGQTGAVAVNLPIDKRKQGKETRKATVSDILMTLSVIAFAVIMIVVIWFVEDGGKLPGLNPNFANNVNAGDVAFITTIVVAFVGMLVIFAVGAYLKAKRTVKDSMHNVEEAADADAFIEGASLNITLSADKKGPKFDENNWPDR